MTELGTSGGLALKALCAVCLAGLALPAYRAAELAHLRVNDAAAAYRIQPHDARALSKVLAARLATDPSLRMGTQDRANLRAALIARPLSPELLALAAVSRGGEGQEQAAQDLMEAASKASRRSASASLWLIEAASISGDIPAALKHYHAALSVHTDLQPTLLPVLARAATYAEVRSALRPYLARPAPWAGALVDAALVHTRAGDLAALLTPLPPALQSIEYRARLGHVLERLAIETSEKAVSRFASAVVPGFKPATLSTLAVSEQAIDPRLGRLAWSFPVSEGLVVEAAGDGTLQVTAQPLARGPAAVRDLVVTGGARYFLAQRVAFGPEAIKPGLTWYGACVGRAGAEPAFWEQRVPGRDGATTYRSVFSVPEDCRVVRFTLSILGPDGQAAAVVHLNNFELSRAD